jgi:hypothetical protein
MSGRHGGLRNGGALGGTRTPNLLIRSQMLYPLSYERLADAAGLRRRLAAERHMGGVKLTASDSAPLVYGTTNSRRRGQAGPAPAMA